MESRPERFRPIRRTKQQMTEAECIEVLKSAKRGVLSMVGDGGWPYGIPIDHCYDEMNGRLYFHGAKAGHHIDAIRACNKVSYAVTDGGRPVEGAWWLAFKSVIVFGTIREVTDVGEAERVCRLLSKKFTSDDAYIDAEIKKFLSAVLCLELTPVHIAGKIVNER